MKFGRFFLADRIGAAARIDARVPHGFTRIDVADSGDAGLIEQEFFERASRSSQKRSETSRSELFRERIHAERLQSGTRFPRLEKMNTAEMAPICKAKH